MKIVNVNGRLETSGTLEEAEAQAAARVACIAQQRAELRAMLSGNMQFHADPHAAVPVVHIGVDMGAPGGDCTAVVLAAAKPPAVWRTVAQIPESERNGLWFFARFFRISPKGATAEERLFSANCGSYLRAPEGTKPGTKYDPSMYQQPDDAGWFTHDPREDSVCPVPVGVKYEAKSRDGDISPPDAFDDGDLAWQIGRVRDRSPHPHDIVAWRVVA